MIIKAVRKIPNDKQTLNAFKRPFQRTAPINDVIKLEVLDLGM